MQVDTVLINLVKNLIDKAQVSMVFIQRLHIPISRYHHVLSRTCFDLTNLLIAKAYIQNVFICKVDQMISNYTS